MCALVQTVMFAEMPGKLWTDYHTILDSIARGPRWCTRSTGQAADLWRMFCWKIADHGGIDLWQLEKILAHLTCAMKKHLELDFLRPVWANECADKRAKDMAATDYWGKVCRQALSQATQQVVDALLTHIETLTAAVVDEGPRWCDVDTDMEKQLKVNPATQPVHKGRPPHVWICHELDMHTLYANYTSTTRRRRAMQRTPCGKTPLGLGEPLCCCERASSMANWPIYLVPSLWLAHIEIGALFKGRMCAGNAPSLLWCSKGQRGAWLLAKAQASARCHWPAKTADSPGLAAVHS